MEVSVAEVSLVDEGVVVAGDSSGLQENGKKLGLLHDNGKKTVEGDVSTPEIVSAVNEDETIGVQKKLNDRATRVNGGDSAREMEVSRNGISLVVEVHGSSASIDQDNQCGAKHLMFLARKQNPTSESAVRKNSNSDHESMYKENRASLPENEEDPCAKVTEMPGMTKNSTAEEDEGNEKEQVSDEEEEEMDDQEYKFSVGDFVWGKIKSHPWWPGQIYDPSYASKYATKYQRRDRLLVAYFGDGTFAWCYPSQLKPFQENFERLSKQSNSKSFLNAVEKAVDEIGRRVGLEMTCFCIPKETRTGLARPLAVNAGIKEGITVPEGGIGEHSITLYEPAKFLGHLRYIAQVVSISSMLELTVIRSRLSAFYRAKGYSQLPMYHQPHEIIDPEDKGDFNGQMGNVIPSSPEEDWLSSPISPGFGKASQTSSQKWPGISEDKLYQRKQKSMAELLAGEMVVEPENDRSDVAKEGTVSGKPASSSRKKKRNKDSEVRNGSAAEDIGGSKSATPSKRKMTRLSGSRTTAENKGSSVKNDDGGAKVKTKIGSASRERKKSKYLSPPYTILIRRHKSLSSLRDSETEIPKVPKVSRLGQGTRSAFGLIQSPPNVKDSGETFQKKSSKEPGSGLNMSERLRPRKKYHSGNISKGVANGSAGSPIIDGSRTAKPMLQPKQNQNKIVPKENKASASKMLSQFQSAALNPLYLRENHSSDTIKGFFSRFRSSLYRNGSNYEMYKKHLAGQTARKKRKSLDAKHGSLVKDKQETDHYSLQGKSDRKKIKRNEVMPERTKIKRAAGTDVKINEKKETKGEDSPATLLVTFAQGFPLPSKDDLITKFSRFGVLNKSETEVLEDSRSARAVYLRSSDAETAFKNSKKTNPFGPAVVSYRLRYFSATSRALKVDENSRQRHTSPPAEGGETPANPSASQNPVGKTPPLVLIRQNLEVMTSVLEKSEDKLSSEVKADLEDGIKGLLKKVSTMVESSS